jgi:hypothetical protein
MAFLPRKLYYYVFYQFSTPSPSPCPHDNDVTVTPLQKPMLSKSSSKRKLGNLPEDRLVGENIQTC